MTDVRIFHAPDGGNIEMLNGVFTMNDGLEGSAYLSLFGGNERDSGREADDALQWWGNRGELDPARQYRSETQNLLRDIPATSGNLQRIEDAAERDLAWMKDAFATQVAARATMPAVNRVALAIAIDVDGITYKFDFTQQWGAPNR